MQSYFIILLHFDRSNMSAV